MEALQGQQPNSMPKRACMITIAFAITTDEAALVIKHAIDDVVSDIKEKRLTFQIIES
jgi:hypothetical protein